MGRQDPLFSASSFRFYKIQPIRHPEIATRVRKLWLAVLQRALQDYIEFCDSTQPDEVEEFAEVHAWLHAPEEDYLGSFRSVCDLLDIDARKVLHHLDNMDEEGLRDLRKSRLEDVQ